MSDPTVSMSSRLGQSYRILRTVLHQPFAPLVSGLGIALIRQLVTLGQFLDRLFVGRLKTTRVRSPIVIVGNPRSGTTFLHRWLDKNEVGAAVPLWRLIFPTLSVGALLSPLLPLLEKVSPARHHSAAAHKTSLTSAETDDASLFFRFHDGLFLFGFIWAWAEDDLRPYFEPEHRDTSARDFDWLEEVWRRHLVASGKDRVVAKLFSLSPRLPAFLERFPEARILYMVRDPLSVLPSSMSLITGVLDQRFGFWSQPEELRRRYLERLYRSLADLYLRFHQEWMAGRVDRERVLVVRFDRMMDDFETVMGDILTFTGTERTPALEAAIGATADKQRAYKSGHAYDLEKFGLTEERIRADLAPIYETFLS